MDRDVDIPFHSTLERKGQKDTTARTLNGERSAKAVAESRLARGWVGGAGALSTRLHGKKSHPAGHIVYKNLDAG